MNKSIEIIVDENGNLSIEGFGLAPGEKIEDVAKDFSRALGEITETGHKHSHNETETEQRLLN